MIEIHCIGEVKESEITIFNRTEMRSQLRGLEGKNIEIIIREKIDKRTDQQNKYYWAGIIRKIRLGIFEMSGDMYKDEDIHDFLRGRFNATYVTNPETGETVTIPKRTSELNIIDFIVYIDQCKQFAMEFLNLDVDKGDI